MRYTAFFFIMVLHLGCLFAQAPIPMHGITREAMQAYATHDTMVYYQANIANCCGAYVIRHPVGDWADQRVWEISEIKFDIPKVKVLPDNALELNTNAIPLKWGLGFVSGASRGLNQVVAFHPHKLFARYPDANRRYWDNSVSWQNKWRNGDPRQGEAFPGSSTVFVWTTDALHLSGTISNISGVASLTIPLYKGCGKMNIWKRLAGVGITSAGYWLGFHSVYSWWF